MSIAKTGDQVAVHYTGKHTDGAIFDSSVGKTPLEFQLGSGMVIKGFDDGVTGMTIGEKKTVLIPAAEAYGEHSPENTVTLERAQVPAHIELEVGASLSMHQDGGHVVEVVITDLTDSYVTLDANHPLAGRDLTFELELVSIS
ncbi:FKBP-type peptidyl-prolyl cis-trans isomerase [Aquirufa sp. A-Brett2-W8]